MWGSEPPIRQLLEMQLISVEHRNISHLGEQLIPNIKNTFLMVSKSLLVLRMGTELSLHELRGKALQLTVPSALLLFSAQHLMLGGL